MKACSICGTTKPISEFCPDKRRSQGVSGYCRACEYAKKKAKRDEEKARLKDIGLDPNGRRTCHACQTIKKNTEFQVCKTARRGRKNECMECCRERMNQKHRDYHKRNPNRKPAYDLRTKYGLTMDEHESMVQACGNLCECCGRPQTHKRHKRLVVDHCHRTGKTRGLLCSLCNTAIGQLGDSVEVLTKCIEYLRRHAA